MSPPGENDAEGEKQGSTTSPETATAGTKPSAGLLGLVRQHPWITGIMLACTVGGGVAGPQLFDDEWSLLRQVAAGAFGGAWVGITITVTKMIGD